MRAGGREGRKRERESMKEEGQEDSQGVGRASVCVSSTSYIISSKVTKNIIIKQNNNNTVNNI